MSSSFTVAGGGYDLLPQRSDVSGSSSSAGHQLQVTAVPFAPAAAPASVGTFICTSGGGGGSAAQSAAVPSMGYQAYFTPSSPTLPLPPPQYGSAAATAAVSARFLSTNSSASSPTHSHAAGPPPPQSLTPPPTYAASQASSTTAAAAAPPAVAPLAIGLGVAVEVSEGTTRRRRGAAALPTTVTGGGGGSAGSVVSSADARSIASHPSPVLIADAKGDSRRVKDGAFQQQLSNGGKGSGQADTSIISSTLSPQQSSQQHQQQQQHSSGGGGGGEEQPASPFALLPPSVVIMSGANQRKRKKKKATGYAADIQREKSGEKPPSASPHKGASRQQQQQQHANATSVSGSASGSGGGSSKDSNSNTAPRTGAEAAAQATALVPPPLPPFAIDGEDEGEEVYAEGNGDCFAIDANVQPHPTRRTASAAAAVPHNRSIAYSIKTNSSRSGGSDSDSEGDAAEGEEGPNALHLFGTSLAAPATSSAPQEAATEANAIAASGANATASFPPRNTFHGGGEGDDMYDDDDDARAFSTRSHCGSFGHQHHFGGVGGGGTPSNAHLHHQHPNLNFGASVPSTDEAAATLLLLPPTAPLTATIGPNGRPTAAAGGQSAALVGDVPTGTSPSLLNPSVAAAAAEDEARHRRLSQQQQQRYQRSSFLPNPNPQGLNHGVFHHGGGKAAEGGCGGRAAGEGGDHSAACAHAKMATVNSAHTMMMMEDLLLASAAQRRQGGGGAEGDNGALPPPPPYSGTTAAAFGAHSAFSLSPSFCYDHHNAFGGSALPPPFASNDSFGGAMVGGGGFGGGNSPYAATERPRSSTRLFASDSSSPPFFAVGAATAHPSLSDHHSLSQHTLLLSHNRAPHHHHGGPSGLGLTLGGAPPNSYSYAAQPAQQQQQQHFQQLHSMGSGSRSGHSQYLFSPHVAVSPKNGGRSGAAAASAAGHMFASSSSLLGTMVFAANGGGATMMAAASNSALLSPLAAATATGAEVGGAATTDANITTVELNGRQASKARRKERQALRRAAGRGAAIDATAAAVQQMSDITEEDDAASKGFAFPSIVDDAPPQPHQMPPNQANLSSSPPAQQAKETIVQPSLTTSALTTAQQSPTRNHPPKRCIITASFPQSAGGLGLSLVGASPFPGPSFDLADSNGNGNGNGGGIPFPPSPPNTPALGPLASNDVDVPLSRAAEKNKLRRQKQRTRRHYGRLAAFLLGAVGAAAEELGLEDVGEAEVEADGCGDDALMPKTTTEAAKAAASVNLPPLGASEEKERAVGGEEGEGSGQPAASEDTNGHVAIKERRSSESPPTTVDAIIHRREASTLLGVIGAERYVNGNGTNGGNGNGAVAEGAAGTPQQTISTAVTPPRRPMLSSSASAADMLGLSVTAAAGGSVATGGGTLGSLPLLLAPTTSSQAAAASSPPAPTAASVGRPYSPQAAAEGTNNSIVVASGTVADGQRPHTTSTPPSTPSGIISGSLGLFEGGSAAVSPSARGAIAHEDTMDGEAEALVMRAHIAAAEELLLFSEDRAEVGKETSAAETRERQPPTNSDAGASVGIGSGADEGSGSTPTSFSSLRGAGFPAPQHSSVVGAGANVAGGGGGGGHKLPLRSSAATSPTCVSPPSTGAFPFGPSAMGAGIGIGLGRAHSGGAPPHQQPQQHQQHRGASSSLLSFPNRRGGGSGAPPSPVERGGWGSSSAAIGTPTSPAPPPRPLSPAHLLEHTTATQQRRGAAAQGPRAQMSSDGGGNSNSYINSNSTSGDRESSGRAIEGYSPHRMSATAVCSPATGAHAPIAIIGGGAAPKVYNGAQGQAHDGGTAAAVAGYPRVIRSNSHSHPHPSSSTPTSPWPRGDEAFPSATVAAAASPPWLASFGVAAVVGSPQLRGSEAEYGDGDALLAPPPFLATPTSPTEALPLPHPSHVVTPSGRQVVVSLGARQSSSPMSRQVSSSAGAAAAASAAAALYTAHSTSFSSSVGATAEIGNGALVGVGVAVPEIRTPRAEIRTPRAAASSHSRRVSYGEGAVDAGCAATSMPTDDGAANVSSVTASFSHHHHHNQNLHRHQQPTATTSAGKRQMPPRQQTLSSRSYSATYYGSAANMSCLVEVGNDDGGYHHGHPHDDDEDAIESSSDDDGGQARRRPPPTATTALLDGNAHRANSSVGRSAFVPNANAAIPPSSSHFLPRNDSAFSLSGADASVFGASLHRTHSAESAGHFLTARTPTTAGSGALLSFPQQLATPMRDVVDSNNPRQPAAAAAPSYSSVAVVAPSPRACNCDSDATARFILSELLLSVAEGKKKKEKKSVCGGSSVNAACASGETHSGEDDATKHGKESEEKHHDGNAADATTAAEASPTVGSATTAADAEADSPAAVASVFGADRHFPLSAIVGPPAARTVHLRFLPPYMSAEQLRSDLLQPFGPILRVRICAVVRGGGGGGGNGGGAVVGITACSHKSIATASVAATEDLHAPMPANVEEREEVLPSSSSSPPMLPSSLPLDADATVPKWLYAFVEVASPSQAAHMAAVLSGLVVVPTDPVGAHYMRCGEESDEKEEGDAKGYGEFEVFCHRPPRGLAFADGTAAGLSVLFPPPYAVYAKNAAAAARHRSAYTERLDAIASTARLRQQQRQRHDEEDGGEKAEAGADATLRSSPPPPAGGFLLPPLVVFPVALPHIRSAVSSAGVVQVNSSTNPHPYPPTRRGVSFAEACRLHHYRLAATLASHAVVDGPPLGEGRDWLVLDDDDTRKPQTTHTQKPRRATPLAADGNEADSKEEEEGDCSGGQPSRRLFSQSTFGVDVARAVAPSKLIMMAAGESEGTDTTACANIGCVGTDGRGKFSRCALNAATEAVASVPACSVSLAFAILRQRLFQRLSSSSLCANDDAVTNGPTYPL